MYVRSVIKKCPVCGSLSIMRLDENQEKAYLAKELAEYLPDNLKFWYAFGVCPECSKSDCSKLHRVEGYDVLAEEMRKSDEEATRFLMDMLSLCNGNEDDLAGTLLALNLLDMEDVCYVDDTFTVRPRPTNNPVDGYTHMIMPIETDMKQFMLLTDEEYEDYFNVTFAYSEKYDKLPLKIQTYSSLGVVSEELLPRMRDVNKSNYNKYRELIIRSLGGVKLRNMFEEVTNEENS